MKPAIYKIVVLAALLAIPAARPYAQSTGTWFKVPFQFTVGDATMPAGHYFVEGLWWNAVAFHHGEGKAGLILLTQKRPRLQEVTPKLVFHRYGNLYFLAEAQLPNTDSGRVFPVGKEEMELAKTQESGKVEVAGR